MFKRLALPAALLFLFGPLLLLAPGPAGAQVFTVENGATLTLENGGVWDLEGTTFRLGGVGSTAAIEERGSGRFAGGALTATRQLSAPSQADPAGLGALISSGEDLGATTVTRGHAVQTAQNGNESIARYFDISPAQNSGLGATLTLTYKDAELGGLSEPNLELFKSEDGGDTWSEEGQDGRDPEANSVTLGGIESFSRWTLGSEASPLPVEIASFEGTAVEGGIRLTWRVASETGNAGFEVQRKAESSGWAKLGYVESKAPGGTATKAQSYEYVAIGLPVGTHRFRLRQVDIDGSSALHGPITATVQMEEALRLEAPAPNPANGAATAFFAVKEQARATVSVYNTLGQQVATLYEGTPQAGERHRVHVDASGLTSGIYFIRLRSGGKTVTRRLTVVR